MGDTDPHRLLELAASLASRAGDLLRGGLDQARREVSTKSSATDMVTEMDRASEDLILSGLAEHRPADAVVAEERGRSEGTTGVRWLVDPLDGTTNYLYRLPAFAVSIAAHGPEGPLLGVVHDPSREATYTALAGEGAWLDGTRLRRSPAPALDRALIGTGFSYDPARRAAQARLLPTVLPAVRDIRRVGAAALDLCWVAAGHLDGFYEAGLAPWDVAAGALVAREAGASVASVAATQALPEVVVAAAPGLGDPLDDLVRRALATGR